jgi:hypothetical protein
MGMRSSAIVTLAATTFLACSTFGESPDAPDAGTDATSPADAAAPGDGGGGCAHTKCVDFSAIKAPWSVSNDTGTASASPSGLTLSIPNQTANGAQLRLAIDPPEPHVKCAMKFRLDETAQAGSVYILSLLAETPDVFVGASLGFDGLVTAKRGLPALSVFGTTSKSISRGSVVTVSLEAGANVAPQYTQSPTIVLTAVETLKAGGIRAANFMLRPDSVQGPSGESWRVFILEAYCDFLQ